MKEKVLVCEHYKCNGGICKLGKICHFWKEMQKCQKYIPNKKSRPIRTNNKKEKLEKIRKKESGFYD